MYCGTSRTWPGSISVPSMRAKNSFRPVNSIRAKAYAAKAQEKMLPMMEKITTTMELIRYTWNG